MQQPVALVTNVTRSHGHFLNVRLKAVTAARDAIGAVIEVTSGEVVASKQLVAGDGYQASNERMLQFGLGDAEQIDSVVVRWPSGSITRIAQVPLDITLDLVEGRELATLWRDGQPESFQLQTQSDGRIAAGGEE